MRDCEQNSRLDAHREISDTLLREMKELRQRGDAMEKRLREVEVDNAVRMFGMTWCGLHVWTRWVPVFDTLLLN